MIYIKKLLKIAIGIIVAIIVVYGIIFFIDYNRVINLKEPIINISKYEETGFVEYKGLGYKTITEYSFINNEKQITKIEMYMFNKVVVASITDYNIEKTNEELNNNDNYSMMARVNGRLYISTGNESTITSRCGIMDGQITSNVSKEVIPTEDNQSNFEGEYSYQYGRNNTIEVNINGEWIIFKANEYSFCGVIKQVEKNLFFVEPDEGEEIRKSADLIMVEKLQLDTNVKFEVGEKVKITYAGYVMETYPAQIKAINYETIEDNKLKNGKN